MSPIIGLDCIHLHHFPRSLDQSENHMFFFSFFLAYSFGAQRLCSCVPGTQAQLQMLLRKVMVGWGLSWTNEEASRRPTYEQAHETVEKDLLSRGNRRAQSICWSGVGSWWTEKKNKHEIKPISIIYLWPRFIPSLVSLNNWARPGSVSQMKPILPWVVFGQCSTTAMKIKLRLVCFLGTQ